MKNIFNLIKRAVGFVISLFTRSAKALTTTVTAGIDIIDEHAENALTTVHYRPFREQCATNETLIEVIKHLELTVSYDHNSRNWTCSKAGFGTATGDTFDQAIAEYIKQFDIKPEPKFLTIN
jgi:hypothetical protein